MYKQKSQQSGADSVLPMASGENDNSVFGAPLAPIRGKGLGLPSISQNSLKYQGSISKVSQKFALGDVNCKAAAEKFRLNVTTKLASKDDGGKSAQTLQYSKQKLGSPNENTVSEGTYDCAKREIGRNVKLNWEAVLSPGIPNIVQDFNDENQVEPMIQNYYDMHGEYPEIESITTNQSNYNDEWYYISQSPEMVPEAFDRSFDSIEEAELDVADLCLDAPNQSLSSASLEFFEVELNGLNFEESCDAEWDEWDVDNTDYYSN